MLRVLCPQASPWYTVMLALLRAMDWGDTVTFVRSIQAAPFLLASVLALYCPIFARWAARLTMSLQPGGLDLPTL